MVREQQTAISNRGVQGGVGPQIGRAGEWGRALFEECLNAVVIVRIPDGVVLDANGSACRDLGYSRRELLELFWADVLDGPNKDICALKPQDIGKQSDEAERGLIQTTLVTKKGERRTVQLRCHTLPCGSIQCGMLIWQDITETTRAAECLHKQEKELTHMARVGLMGKFVAILAHEVNQPICAIISNAQAAQRMQNARSQQTTLIAEILEDIVSDGRRAADVLGNLHAMLQKKNQAKRPEDINEVIRNIERYIRKDADRLGVCVRFDPGEPILPVMINRVEIQQVILDLLRNAFEATAGPGTTDNVVTLRTRAKDSNWARVTVIDGGVGVPEHLVSQLFSPFFSTKCDGLGMGLAISKLIIDSNGGQIHAHANDDRGMSFSFTLPVYRPAEHAEIRKSR